MKYLYDLALNNKDIMINRASEFCGRNAFVSAVYYNDEIQHNIINNLYSIILKSMENTNFTSINSITDVNFAKIAGSTDADNIRDFLMNGADIKLLIAILKQFRNGINDVIVNITDNNKELLERLDTSSRYFDFLEFSFYTYWETLKCIEINDRKCTLDMVVDMADLRKIEELRQQASDSIKLLNEAIENDKIKTEFFSNLSHELRTPLNVILGTLQLVDMYSEKITDPAMDKAKKYYRIMRQNCYRLLRLVNNLIDINKLDAGYMQMNMENHDIVCIVSKIAASVSDYIENKGIRFEYCSRTAAKVIACDPDMIERIVLNLLSNAIKFTDSGGHILVSLWDEDNKMLISVKDSGVGIPYEKQDLVFKRFVQIDKSLARNYQGSGIGLSLVKSLVELHGGNIILNSEIGKGSEFIIEFPIRQMNVAEITNSETHYRTNNKIEVINIEFSDIYS